MSTQSKQTELDMTRPGNLWHVIVQFEGADAPSEVWTKALTQDDIIEALEEQCEQQGVNGQVLVIEPVTLH